MTSFPVDLDKTLRLTIANLVTELPYLDTFEDMYHSARAIESLSKAIANLRQPFTPIESADGRLIPFPSPEPETKPKRRRKPGQPSVTRKSKAIASPINKDRELLKFPPFDPMTGRRIFDSPDREPDYPDLVPKAIEKPLEGNHLAEMIAELQKEIRSLKAPKSTPAPAPETPKEPEPIASYSWSDGTPAGKEYYEPSANTLQGFNSAIPKNNPEEYPKDDYTEGDYPDFWNP